MYSEVVENVVQLAYSWILPGVITGNSPACTSHAEKHQCENNSGHSCEIKNCVVHWSDIVTVIALHSLKDYRIISAYLFAEQSWFLLNRDESYPQHRGHGPLPHFHSHLWSSSIDCLAGMHSLGGPTLPSQSWCIWHRSEVAGLTHCIALLSLSSAALCYCSLWK